MKIHYLVTSLENGGAEFAIPSILNTLRKYGCEIQVTFCEPRDMKAANHLREANISYTIMFNKKRNKILYIIKFLYILLYNKPDVIWTSLSAATVVGQIAGKILRIPVVSWKHSADIKFYNKFLSNLTKLWIADSSVVETFLHKEMSIPQDRIKTWPLYFCNTSDVISSYWKNSSTLYLGSMGRLREQKNYSSLIKAIYIFSQKHPDLINNLKLFIAGDGPLKETLQNQINNYNLEKTVILKGYYDNPEEFLKTLDIYIQPSLFEGMCLAAHEAMAIGLPVIATPVGELAFSVIPNKTGFLISNNLEDELSSILKTIFSNPDIIALYGQQSRLFVEQKFSIKDFNTAGSNILDYIKKLL